MIDNLTIGFILIAAAFVLLAAEFFLPTGGVLLVVAGCADLVGLVMVFQYGDRYLGFVTLAVEAVTLPVLATLFVYIWPRTPMGRRMIMRRLHQDAATVVDIPENAELEELRGRIGKVMTVLRPAGVVEFDGRRVDCLSEGILIEPGNWVRCIDVRATKVIVRPVDKPNLTDLENASFDV